MQTSTVSLSAVGQLSNVTGICGGGIKLVAIMSIAYCNDELIFKCKINDNLRSLFVSLREILRRGDEVRLQFEASYTNIFIQNCITKNDPDRIINFNATLCKVGFVLVNGKVI